MPLAAARRLGAERNVDVVTTFLGLHALPPEFREDRIGYVDAVCAMIPTIAGVRSRFGRGGKGGRGAERGWARP